MENDSIHENIVSGRSFRLSVRIVTLYKYLNERYKAYSLAHQLLRSGTSIGANVTEAQDAQSKKEFISKISIALKEAKETRYRLHLLIETEFLGKTHQHISTLLSDTEELIKLPTSITITSKESR
ncbi:four helix bundle protein [Hydrogenimonas sp.]